MATVADFIRFADADRDIMRRVSVNTVAEYFAPTSPGEKGLTKVVFKHGGHVYTRHTPEEIDKAIESEGRVVSV
jgi:hypothetical protein